MAEQKLRCFLAVELGDPVKELIRKIQRDLKKSDADVKWVKPENAHLTLKFFGDLEEKQIDQIRKELDLIAPKARTFSLETTTTGAFPRTENPRVIWLGCQDTAGDLKNLVSDIETRLEPLGFAREERNFAAHITLGRVRSARNKSALISLLKNTPGYPGIKNPIDHLTLFKSTLTSAGPVYEPLAEFSFT